MIAKRVKKNIQKAVKLIPASKLMNCFRATSLEAKIECILLSRQTSAYVNETLFVKVYDVKRVLLKIPKLST